jgi:DNA-binding NtrC family response regulator
MKSQRSLSVLVVDDEPDIRGLLASIFRAAGFDVTVAESARAAFDLVMNLNFDAVITDIRMPQETGVDLLFWIKAHRPAVKVFLISGNVERADFLEAEQMTAGVFQKPFKGKELVEAVRRGLTA